MNRRHVTWGWFQGGFRTAPAPNPPLSNGASLYGLSDLSDFDRQAIAIVYQRSPGNSTPDTGAPDATVIRRGGDVVTWLIK